MGKLYNKLKKSPINYFSDLFIVAMVVSWVVTLVIMTVMGIYSTITFQDNTIWSDVGVLAAVPLSAGGAIWMIKNSVVHYISARNGKEAKYDFPKVDGTEYEMEEREGDSNETEVG